mgnify:CR=1 FL=1
MTQPGPYDGGTQDDRIAELLRFVPLLRESQQADCQVANKVAAAGNRLLRVLRPGYQMRFYKYSRGFNVVDCAVARPLRPDLIGEEIIELGQVNGLGEAKEGMLVQKSGRTSGVTSGEVTALSVTLQVDLSEEEKGWFSDQVVADLLSKPGDSGSLILDEENRAVGLLFAGSDSHCIFNRIHNVLEALEVEL